MRVTENTNFGVVRDSISRSKNRLEDLQQKSATLRKMNAPSDDPIGAAKVMEIRTDKMNNDQFAMNSKMAETFLDNSDHALNELSEIVMRAKEIALGQSSGASSNDDTRLGVAEEVTQLYNQAIAAANRRVGDRYLFGGYKTDRPPVEPDGKYLGDQGQMMVEIARDVYLPMNLTGHEIFNTHPEGTKDNFETDGQTRAPASELSMEMSGQIGPENVNVFDEIQNLRIALLTGDQDGIHNTLERFDQLHAKLVSSRAKIGSRIQGLQSTTQAMERHNITNAQLGSSLEDADMAQVVSDMAKEETVFRSSLQTSQKLIQPTLLEFLK